MIVYEFVHKIIPGTKNLKKKRGTYEKGDLMFI